MQLAGVCDTIKKIIQIIKKATGVSPIAHFNHWELHLISLRSTSYNLRNAA
jgi:hypothetical protein